MKETRLCRRSLWLLGHRAVHSRLVLWGDDVRGGRFQALSVYLHRGIRAV